MKLTTIYQTLEDRGNDEEVVTCGPFKCLLCDDKGRLKKEEAFPWLGEGYYFWDTLIEDAKWWGKIAYLDKSKEYIVCESQYDQHSSYLLDLVSDIDSIEAIADLANSIAQKDHNHKVNFLKVLRYIEKGDNFPYKAIRALPISGSNLQPYLYFPDSKYSLRRFQKVQVCILDKTILTSPLRIVFKSSQEPSRIQYELR